MRFKRLEMVGFKSFVDRTVIEISDQFTAVVGPNGCGKSNISDAIRWVLGEQAPKSLRAKRMEDVIFNGSADRKPLGMAEVSLTIDDLNGSVSSPAYKDYDELVVTRRLYRSGESEYLINRNPCRLKDITDLFLDTGVSLDTFSIVEQGRIEGLVNAKPLDRRLLIEEAAGIMKYKSRRNEAIRKLELAQANLLRVGDVMREKESRLRSLRRQARKATFFKEYRQEVEDLELMIASLDLLRLEEELAPVENEFGRLKEREEGLLAALSAREAERERCRIELAERSERLAEIRRRAVETEGILQRLENRLEMLSGQLTELDGDDARRREEIDSLSREAERLAEEIRRLREREGTFSEEVVEAQRQFDLGAAELAAVRGEHAEVEAAAARARQAQSEEAEALSRARQRVVFAESQREGVERSLERTGREIEEAGRQRDETKGEVESLAARFDEKSREETGLKAEAERLAAEKERIGGLLREAEAAFSTEREALVEARTSLQELERIEGEGTSERSSAADFRACGVEVMGALADILIVEPAYQRAIEAALGERLLGVVVGGPSAACEAVRALVASGLGRGLALPLEARRQATPDVPAGEGILGSAASFVRCPEVYRDLVESLLGGVGVVRDLDAARAAWARGPEGIVWATISGEVLSSSGAVEGGAPLEERAGLLERARRCEQLRNEVVGAEARIADLEKRCAGLRDDHLRSENEANEKQEDARRAELSRVEVEGELRSARDRLSAAEERCGQIEAERAQLREERERLEREFQEAEAEGARSVVARAEAESRLAAAEEELKRVGARAGVMEADVTERRVALTETQGRLSAVRGELQRLGEGSAENETRLRRRREEEEESARKRERLGLNLAQSREEIGRRREEREAIDADQAERARELDEVRTQEEELGQRLREMRAEAADLQSRLDETSERRTTLRVRREGMIETARETHGSHLPEVAERNREQVPQYQEHANRLEMLRQRLSRMGEVNPLAAREFDEVNQEYAFLKEQQEDLDRSIEDLHATIEKLNRTTRHRFLEAFEQVSTQFAQIFGRLFEGGEARMFLLDPQDPLETGVDIEVRPPGKRPGNIMLLSAGEKALTALALLFSVFSVRPSPFCLLDEVDATLDDANVGRFREILFDLESRSQFLIITHNKRTMSYASQLYGVTQREKGVSLVVSVKLDRREAEEGAAAGGPSAAALGAG